MPWKRLRDLREDNDLYQKDIANKLNITQQTYSLFEQGIKIIPLKHLNTLSNFYNVSIDYLLSLTNIKRYSDNIPITELNKQEIGKRIKEFRDEKKLSFRDLAKLLNTTPSNIHAYEHGKTLILTAFAYQICKKYHISLDYLCGKTKNKTIK